MAGAWLADAAPDAAERPGSRPPGHPRPRGCRPRLCSPTRDASVEQGRRCPRPGRHPGRRQPEARARPRPRPGAGGSKRPMSMPSARSATIDQGPPARMGRSRGFEPGRARASPDRRRRRAVRGGIERRRGALPGEPGQPASVTGRGRPARKYARALLLNS
jgi:hypothetical protein